MLDVGTFMVPGDGLPYTTAMKDSHVLSQNEEATVERRAGRWEIILP